MATSHEGAAGSDGPANYEELQRRHRADAQALLPEYVERLSWSADRLRAERRDRLRELVAVARARSP